MLCGLWFVIRRLFVYLCCWSTLSRLRFEFFIQSGCLFLCCVLGFGFWVRRLGCSRLRLFRLPAAGLGSGFFFFLLLLSSSSFLLPSFLLPSFFLARSRRSRTCFMTPSALSSSPSSVPTLPAPTQQTPQTYSFIARSAITTKRCIRDVPHPATSRYASSQRRSISAAFGIT